MFCRRQSVAIRSDFRKGRFTDGNKLDVRRPARGGKCFFILVTVPTLPLGAAGQ